LIELRSGWLLHLDRLLERCLDAIPVKNARLHTRSGRR